MSQSATLSWLQRIATGILIGCLIGFVYVIFEPFLTSIAWAVLLAYITWPVYVRFRSKMREQHSLSALLAVICLSITLILPLLWLIGFVQQDLMTIYNAGAAYLRRPQPTLPDFILHLPWVGALLQNWLTQHISDPAQFKQNLAHWLQTGASHVLVCWAGSEETPRSLRSPSSRCSFSIGMEKLCFIRSGPRCITWSEVESMIIYALPAA